MEVLRTLVLIAATLSTGLVAGVFALYAHTIMPALRKVDDRTFVAAFQAIDRAIINPWFLGGSFFGAFVLGAVAAIVHWRGGALASVLAALLLYLVTLVITVAIHLPLNGRLKAAGDLVRSADLAAAREQFNEPRWARWNLVRVVTTTTAFGLLAWALVVHGRST